MKKICLITTTRADFGIIKNLIHKLKENKKFKIKIIAGGSHFLKSFGKTISEIKKERIKIDYSIKLKAFKDDAKTIAKAFAETTYSTCSILKKISPDILIVVGDRYEILASVVAANFLRIPIAHLYGGEITEGSMDDSFRHSITKLSHVHFVANKVYRQRLIQLGESSKNIHVVGGLAADNISCLKFLSKKDLEKKLKLKFKKNNYVVNFHPETSKKNSTRVQIDTILKALQNFKNSNFIFTSPGFDLENNIISKRIKKLVREKKNIFFFKSLGQLKYFSLLKYSTGMIGNSSSGILEMPYFKKPSINLGTRQKGRLTSKSIINCSIEIGSIRKALTKLENKKNLKKINYSLPYGRSGAIKKIIKILENIKLNNLFIKKFQDKKLI